MALFTLYTLDFFWSLCTKVKQLEKDKNQIGNYSWLCFYLMDGWVYIKTTKLWPLYVRGLRDKLGFCGVCVNLSIMDERTLVKANPLYIEGQFVLIRPHHTDLWDFDTIPWSNHENIWMLRLCSKLLHYHLCNGHVTLDNTNHWLRTFDVCTNTLIGNVRMQCSKHSIT